MDWEGAQVKILSDVSRATLQCRALLRPVLDRVRQMGHTYHWGFPISVTIQKGSFSFTLRLQTALQDFFSFLDIEIAQESRSPSLAHPHINPDLNTRIEWLLQRDLRNLNRLSVCHFMTPSILPRYLFVCIPRLTGYAQSRCSVDGACTISAYII